MAEPSSGVCTSRKKSKKAGSKTKEQKMRKRCRCRHDGFSIFIYRVLKKVHSELGISRKAVGVINCLLKDIFQRIAEEATHLAGYTSHSTIITSRAIQTAARLLLPGELGKLAVSEGTKAVSRYKSRK
ncbi:histone H2B type 1-B-like [Loxodonta africana]|uniref:Core Histone H2A/H2B/H3 domain-containing protein n=1 Tax=Loxodonta africana TaxID=9785 RepID=G3TSU3_LOXAF|nr:histone H2B type 1-B-like [Loxodonta africana]XP_003414785.1 histone H2B type 1-B-like [Loxodonta africana]XP_049727394.1 histone H2B type 1-B-like [Elephas maximus indicus]XP_049727589.1 histone H2B type 1-B-like [Elephas maximus indicus]